MGIDWQWTGINVGAWELFYFMMTTAPDVALYDGAYLQLLRVYHQAFLSAIQKRNGGNSVDKEYSFEELLRLFKIATLDLVRWAICARLHQETPQKFRERAAAQPLNI